MKKEFLAQIDRLVPWGEWIAEIKPCYYKGERGNKPCGLELMLRIYMLRKLYDLSDMATVAEVIDSRAFFEFCGVDSSNHLDTTLGCFAKSCRTHRKAETAEPYSCIGCFPQLRSGRPPRQKEAGGQSHESDRDRPTHRRPWPGRDPQGDPPDSAHPGERPVADDIGKLAEILLRHV